MPSKQKTFDTVARHLLKQGKRSAAQLSSKPQRNCAYRGDDGCMCAAGVLIPDDKYTRDMELGLIRTNYTVINHLPSRLVSACLDGEGHDLDLVARLQSVHDSKDPADWRRELAAVAKNFDLNTAAIGEVAA